MSHAVNFSRIPPALIRQGSLWALCIAEFGFGPSPALSDAPAATLRVSVVGEVQTLDWHRAGSAIEGGIIQNLMRGLYSIDEKNQLLSALAASHEIFEDGLVYRFKLKQGPLWSDGKHVSAHHFVEGWKRLLDPAKKHRYAYLLFDIESARAYSQGRIRDFNEVGIKALDDLTLEVRLKGRRPHFLWNLTLWPTFPVRADLIRKFGEKDWVKPGKLVGNGAFILSDLRRSYPSRNTDELRLTRNPLFPSPAGVVQTLSISVGPLTTQTLEGFKRGQTDYIPFVYPGEIDSREAVFRRLTRMPSARIIHLNFNTVRGPAAHRNVRRAIALAIEKNAFRSLLEWGYQPLHTFSPQGWLGQDSKPGILFNPGAARRELLSAGSQIDRSQALHLAALKAPDTLTAARTLVDQLQRNLGLEVVLHEIPPSQVGAAIRATSRYDLWLFSVSAKHPEPEYFYSLFASDSRNNQTGFQNSSYDTLLQLVRTDPSPERRSRYYRDISRILVEEEVVAFPLFQDARSALIAPEITGLDHSLFRPLDFTAVQRKPASRPVPAAEPVKARTGHSFERDRNP